MEDRWFGATHDAFKHNWNVSGIVNPPYEPALLLQAYNHSVLSLQTTRRPVIHLFVVPEWAVTNMLKQNRYPYSRKLITVPPRHFSFMHYHHNLDVRKPAFGGPGAPFTTCFLLVFNEPAIPVLNTVQWDRMERLFRRMYPAANFDTTYFRNWDVQHELGKNNGYQDKVQRIECLRRDWIVERM